MLFRSPIAPTFIVTHTVPGQWAREGSPFTFVTDGVQSAIRQAKAVAGEKNVIVETPSMMQQCLKAGLLDEMHVDLRVPTLRRQAIQPLAIYRFCALLTI